MNAFLGYKFSTKNLTLYENENDENDENDKNDENDENDENDGNEIMN